MILYPILEEISYHIHSFPFATFLLNKGHLPVQVLTVQFIFKLQSNIPSYVLVTAPHHLTTGMMDQGGNVCQSY